MVRKLIIGDSPRARRFPVLAVAGLFLAGCAGSTASGGIRAPTEAEVQECDARGGAIEPAYALDTYVCLLPREDRAGD
jgi:hypothetical protein